MNKGKIYAVENGCIHEGMGLASLHFTHQGALARAQQIVEEYRKENKKLWEGRKGFENMIREWEINTEPLGDRLFWASDGMDGVSIYYQEVDE